MSTGLTPPPKDGKIYGMKDGQWVVLS